ncbi:hypothetical protein QJS10_CPB11g02328 [Acorus calamus]|uniref:Uncharacterized protein n=1 Tax=Acorus calamus TaxID=4465 RepID=A0AAV9DZ36_ACOCL|nr:hypothetical protein QJS10_CPB11g02328 [Acorus calamus]
MGSMSGFLHRPFTAAAVVAIASVSTDLPDWLPFRSSPSSDSASVSDVPKKFESWVSQFSVLNLSFTSRIQVPLTDVNYPVPNSSLSQIPSIVSSRVASPPVFLSPYESAKLADVKRPDSRNTKSISLVAPPPPSEVLYRWHLPQTNFAAGKSDCSLAKSQTVVVLLGWLGAKQKHLKRYADWYTSRGYHAVTFTFPMSDILSYRVDGKAEKNLELLAGHLAEWVAEEGGKKLVFHTFSNTGWLTYGVILEKFQKQDPSLMGKIKGCVIDSAPVAAPDPQVWASGFSAAFLKKQSVATKGPLSSNELGMKALVGTKNIAEEKPAVAEAALLAVLEKFFEVVLNLPTVNRRLSDVLDLLSSEQPKCPQLYIYSSADCVIPAKSVESFIEGQRRAGHEVRACDFVSSPHVDHFRNHPSLYTSQLTTFLEDCVLVCCKDSR